MGRGGGTWGDLDHPTPPLRPPRCPGGRRGSRCECEGPEELEGGCRPENSTAPPCSGRGRCVCGACRCPPGLSGRFCQCEEGACERHEGLPCGGGQGSRAWGPVSTVPSPGSRPPPHPVGPVPVQFFGSRPADPFTHLSGPFLWVPPPARDPHPSASISRPQPRIPFPPSPALPPPPRGPSPRIPTRCSSAPRRAAGRMRVRALPVPPRVRRPRLRVSPGAGRLRAGRHRMQRERTLRVRALPLPARVRRDAVRALPELRRELREAAVS